LRVYSGKAFLSPAHPLTTPQSSQLRSLMAFID
jgi:hypothetical protein